MKNALPIVLGVAALGAAAWYFLRKKAQPPTITDRTAPPVIPPGQGALTPPAWNDGMYLGPEQTANQGRGAAALWQTSTYIPAPGKGLNTGGGFQKVWLPSQSFGQKNPSGPSVGNTPSDVASKVYQDTAKPSSSNNTTKVPGWATSFPTAPQGQGPRVKPPTQAVRALRNAVELGKVAAKLQNDVNYRATGTRRGQSRSQVADVVWQGVKVY